MAWRPHSKARVSPRRPQAWGVCDRCNQTRNLNGLQWQYVWAGTALNNTRLLVCERCLDKANEQLRAHKIPADPRPVQNPRPMRFPVE